MHERAEKVQQLSVPTVIFKWKASVLLKYIDMLLAFELSENVKIVETEKDISERCKKMVEVICHSDEGGIWNNFKDKQLR